VGDGRWWSIPRATRPRRQRPYGANGGLSQV
jgi:hypothetical protein